MVSALREAQANPVSRPVETKKLGRVSPYLRSDSPGSNVDRNAQDNKDRKVKEGLVSDNILPDSESQTRHTEIQWELLKLGSDMGLGVWVASNDRSKEYNGQRFQNIKNLRRRLPHQFDRRTSRTIELIDVLWVKNDSIISAFEVESTTKIYSGLLRMSDLLARQPHLNIPLFIVAPESRQEKVMEEITRPTFEALETPLRRVCQFISFESLQERDKNIRAALPSLSVLNADFIQQIAVSAYREDEDGEDD